MSAAGDKKAWTIQIFHFGACSGSNCFLIFKKSFFQYWWGIILTIKHLYLGPALAGGLEDVPVLSIFTALQLVLWLCSKGNIWSSKYLINSFDWEKTKLAKHWVGIGFLWLLFPWNWFMVFLSDCVSCQQEVFSFHQVSFKWHVDAVDCDILVWFKVWWM